MAETTESSTRMHETSDKKKKEEMAAVASQQTTIYIAHSSVSPSIDAAKTCILRVSIMVQHISNILERNEKKRVRLHQLVLCFILF